MKKLLHSSLQNQIWLTTVLVKKWGPSQSSFASYRKLIGHLRVHQGRVSTLHVKKSESGLPPQQKLQTQLARSHQKQYNQSQVEARWKRAARKSFNCYCLWLQFSKLDVTTEGRSVANLMPTFGFQYCARPKCKGRYCHACSNTSERHRLGRGDLHQNTVII